MKKKWFLLGAAALILFIAVGCEEVKDEKTETFSKVWLVGDLTNWLGGEPIEMTKAGNTYTWTGALSSDSYLKFAGCNTSPTEWDNGKTWQLQPTGSNHSVACNIKNEPDVSDFEIIPDEGNNAWRINYAGNYTISVNTSTRKATFIRTTGEDFDIDTSLSIWVVGAAPEKVWGDGMGDDDNKMAETGADTGIFTWTGVLNVAASGFSFTTNQPDGVPGWPSDGAEWYVVADSNDPTVDLADGEEATFDVEKKVAQSPMFDIKAKGNYTVTLNTVTLKATVKCNEILPDVIYDKLQIWVVGAAPEKSWGDGMGDDDNELVETGEDTGIYTWTGGLTADDSQAVSFVTTKSGAGFTKPDWAGTWFKADADGVTIADIATAQEFDLVEGTGQAPMFGLAADGNYTITLDSSTMKVTFQKN